ncbi:hypothetical protein [Streptomyces sp. NBC_00878]|uniref:hypothetical protein n=1 Tax=Streptomyces sp. NBC_00878 TaxID=2975854 RepID=UPI0022546231|nr:hypothetical protein [Streptomyces sp. NBC_00878]MCX4911100.1 hypothetical protein [Streptomyces sp. NBC_00878]
MRITQMLVRSGLTVAAAAALPLTLTAGEAAAVNTVINVTTSGTTVQVTTTDCATRANGSMGNASLLSSGQANFAQGRQVTLSGTSGSQSAAWSSVTTGTYTVIVVCADGRTAGTQSVTVSPVSSPTISATATATRTATPTATASPSRGVMGGIGGATKDYGAVTYAAGGVLVTVGVGAAVWALRRRAKPHRL